MKAERRVAQAAALFLLSLALVPGAARAGGGVPPGSSFTLEFSFPLENFCTYEVTSVDVVPPLATPVSPPATVAGTSADSFTVTFLAGSVPGTGTAQISLLVESPGCEAAAVVSAFYEIGEGTTPPPPPPPPPPGGSGTMSPKEASRSLKREARGELREARRAFRDVVKAFCDDLDALEAGPLAGGAPAGDALDGILDAFNELFGGLSDAVREAGAEITASAFFHFLETNGIPFSGVLAGDCGTLDMARARLAADLDRAIAKALKKFKKLSARVAKNGQGALRAGLAAPSVPPMAPNPAGPAPAPYRKFLEIGATLTVDQPVPGSDGKQVCVSGIADPADGSPVVVQVIVPGSDPETVVAEGEAEIDPEDCTWRLCVAGPGTDPIAPGNYVLRASQPSGLLAETAVGVPAS